MSFANKVVIVTGGSSGIGAATAVSFSKEQASVVIVGRNEAKLTAVADQCPGSLVIKADVSNEDDAKRIIENTLEKFGKIDILINNAGIAKFGAILGGKVMDTYDEVMNTNLRAAVLLTTLAAPHLVETKGNVVNISAIGGTYAPTPPFLAYCMSKAGLNHFTKGAALELAASGVRVNAISPGPVRTDIIANAGFPISWDHFAAQTALGRVSEPEEVAELVLYLASDKAKGITGANYVTDNGMMLSKM
ncbi:meso-2,3-butanediol dehydrogenase-like [Ostrinia nubilalis]|uniref:meso-2,3-butanediol dehydrogenase-like n=1 Tax=Ostrinia nubilalis TaxID=29057 RepID=UPI00308223EC